MDTLCVRGFSYFEERTGSISFPIYQSATFRHPALGKSTGYDYSRQQNPTREEVEKTIALMEKCRFGYGFATGMAAIAAVLSLFRPGDHILATDDLYGGTVRIFDSIYSNYGINCTYIDTGDLDLIEESILPNTKAIYVESPSNPMMKVSDIQKIAELAKQKNILLIVDNTFLTPYFMNPIALGADIVIHSGTKYLGGHNDTLSGFVVTDSEDLSGKIQFYQKAVGGGLSPFDSWLVLRGMKTLALRMDRIENTASFLAGRLKNNPFITKVYYAGLPEHKGNEILKKQAGGFGGMISFETDTEERAISTLANVKLILFAESLGGTESLITYPLVQTHADVPPEKRERLGINNRLLRLSVGIENEMDLALDLEQALEGKS
ncbi:MAG: PLP-dependent transferase [Leptospiraceae bacterium]|nr:PLP-dependent transferase [Leptospiraceae bacterium]